MYQGENHIDDSFESSQIDITALFLQDIVRLPIVGGRNDYLPLTRRVARGRCLRELMVVETATTLFTLREELSGVLDKLAYLSNTEEMLEFVNANVSEFEEFLDNPQLVAPPCVTNLSNNANPKRRKELETTAWRGFYLLGLLPSSMRFNWSEARVSDEILAHFETVLSEYDDSKSALVEGTARYVLRIALGYLQSGMPYSDLIQEGYIGLIRAIDKFDEAKGAHFQSYAATWIKQRILRSIADHSRLIRIPVHFHEEARRIERTRRELESKTGAAPTDSQLFVALEWLSDADVALLERYRSKHHRPRLIQRFRDYQHYFEYLGQPISEVPRQMRTAVTTLARAQAKLSKSDPIEIDRLSLLVEAGWYSEEEAHILRTKKDDFPTSVEAAGALSRLRRARSQMKRHRVAMAKHHSLDYAIGSDPERTSLEDHLISPLNTESLGDRGPLRDAINVAMSLLTKREADVLRWRFGMVDGEERTLEQIGKHFGLTRERIRQIEAKALRKLQKPHQLEALACFLDIDPSSHESIASSLQLRLLHGLREEETTRASPSRYVAKERAHIEALLQKYIMQGRRRRASRSPQGARAESAKEILQKANEPLHYSEIHNRVMRDLPPEYHYPKERTYATLFYSDLFRAYGKGVFGLAEWSKTNILASNRSTLSHCPVPLLPENSSTTAFFDSVVFGRHVLDRSVCTVEAFWVELLAWAQRNDAIHSDAQNAFDAWYAVGLVDRIDYLSERNTSLTCTLPAGLGLDEMRKYCLTTLCQRVSKMSELLLVLIRIPRPTKSLLQRVLFGNEEAGWDVTTRVLMLAAFGAVQQVGNDWRVTPLGRATLDANPAQDLPDFGEIEALEKESEQEAELEFDYADIGLLEF